MDLFLMSRKFGWKWVNNTMQLCPDHVQNKQVAKVKPVIKDGKQRVPLTSEQKATKNAKAAAKRAAAKVTENFSPTGV